MWAIITNNFGKKNVFENPGLYTSGVFWGEKIVSKKPRYFKHDM
jgi:hypothetical protein